MSETYLHIVHCDNCGETMSGDEATDPGWRGWFQVLTYSSGVRMDYCSGKCLFEHAGVANPGGGQG